VSEQTIQEAGVLKSKKHFKTKQEKTV